MHNLLLSEVKMTLIKKLKKNTTLLGCNWHSIEINKCIRKN